MSAGSEPETTWTGEWFKPRWLTTFVLTTQIDEEIAVLSHYRRWNCLPSGALISCALRLCLSLMTAECPLTPRQEIVPSPLRVYNRKLRPLFPPLCDFWDG